MKKRVLQVALIATPAMFLPLFSQAQGIAAGIHSLQGVLNNLYDQMIPLCSRIIDVGRGIAGFAAMWYIAVRVWKHIAAAEPIDFYPLLRPFVIGFCIVNFPMVLSVINGVLQPTVSATAAMVTDSNTAIYNMLDSDQQEKAEQSEQPADINNDPAKWYQYTHPDSPAGPTATTPNPVNEMSGWGIKNMIKKAIAELLNIFFEAAALCIDTIRTFKLIVLAILGPLCFGLSVFDGFQHTLKQWLARYINVYMWLPIANIFGAIISKIQENMIQLEQSGGAASPFFKDTNTAYLIFMCIGIVGYFTVPGIANYIINVGNHPLFSKTSAVTTAVVATTTNAMMQGAFQTSASKPQTSDGNGASGGNNDYMRTKLSDHTTV
ncbi:MAG: conjugative transposon protein TraJ [Bacteroidetes bacterium]|nr:conjugative transposon protein TraJ [Bacteroidota bacterium]